MRDVIIRAYMYLSVLSAVLFRICERTSEEEECREYKAVSGCAIARSWRAILGIPRTQQPGSRLCHCILCYLCRSQKPWRGITDTTPTPPKPRQKRQRTDVSKSPSACSLRRVTFSFDSCGWLFAARLICWIANWYFTGLGFPLRSLLNGSRLKIECIP